MIELWRSNCISQHWPVLVHSIIIKVRLMAVRMRTDATIRFLFVASNVFARRRTDTVFEMQTPFFGVFFFFLFSSQILYTYFDIWLFLVYYFITIFFYISVYISVYLSLYLVQYFCLSCCLCDTQAWLNVILIWIASGKRWSFLFDNNACQIYFGSYLSSFTLLIFNIIKFRLFSAEISFSFGIDLNLFSCLLEV